MEGAKWELVSQAEKRTERIAAKGMSYAKDVWIRFSRKRTALLGLFFVALLLGIALFGPMFSGKTYDHQDLSYVNVPPWLNTYQAGEGYYYITTNLKLVEVSAGGVLLDTVERIRDDTANKRVEYELDGRMVYLNYQGDVNLREEGGGVLPVKTMWNRSFPLGTDHLGRDVLIRLIYGARISLMVAFIAALVNLIIGVLYGSISAYAGGYVDLVMMRIVDIISTIPLTLYVILIMVIFNNAGLASIIIALGSVYWVNMARVVRGQILSLKEQEFVMAARTMGSSTWFILTKHLIPNAMGPIVVTVTMLIPSAIFTEAFMSFIGLGVTAPMASWGTMCNDALDTLRTAPYQLFFPAATICVAMFAFNFIGDGLRDALDPRMRR